MKSDKHIKLVTELHAQTIRPKQIFVSDAISSHIYVTTTARGMTPSCGKVRLKGRKELVYVTEIHKHNTGINNVFLRETATEVQPFSYQRVST